MAILIAIRILFFAKHNIVTGDLQVQNLLEVAVARAIIYPFVFGYYQHLNSFIVVVVFLIWLSFVAFAFGKSGSKAKIFISLNFLSLIFLPSQQY